MKERDELSDTYFLPDGLFGKKNKDNNSKPNLNKETILGTILAVIVYIILSVTIFGFILYGINELNGIIFNYKLSYSIWAYFYISLVIITVKKIIKFL